jgi:hypothetical protein
MPSVAMSRVDGHPLDDQAVDGGGEHGDGGGERKRPSALAEVHVDERGDRSEGGVGEGQHARRPEHQRDRHPDERVAPAGEHAAQRGFEIEHLQPPGASVPLEVAQRSTLAVRRLGRRASVSAPATCSAAAP